MKPTLIRALALCALLPAVAAFGQDTAPQTAPGKDLPEASRIVDWAIDAMGGATKLKAVKSRHVVASLTGSMGEITMESFYGEKGRFLLIQEVGMLVLRMGSDGEVTWIENPMEGSYRIVPEEEAEGLRRRSNMHDQVLYLRKDFPQLETVGRTEFDGQSCYKVKMADKDGEDEQFGYFNVDNKRIAGLEFSRETPLGVMQGSLRFKDWKPFGDFTLFTNVAIEEMGRTANMTIDKLEHDNVDPAKFELPEEVRKMKADRATSRPAGENEADKGDEDDKEEDDETGAGA